MKYEIKMIMIKQKIQKNFSKENFKTKVKKNPPKNFKTQSKNSKKFQKFPKFPKKQTKIQKKFNFLYILKPN